MTCPKDDNLGNNVHRYIVAAFVTGVGLFFPVFFQIQENISLFCQSRDNNINLFCQTRDNILKIMNEYDVIFAFVFLLFVINFNGKLEAFSSKKQYACVIFFL